MVGEKKMRRSSEFNSNLDHSAFGNIGRLIHRLVDLTELQVELLKVDAREGLRFLAVPVLLVVLGVVLGSGAIFVLLLALAQFLVEAGVSEGLAHFVAGVFGLFLAVGAVVLGWRLLQRAAAAFDRSKTELQRNITWLKTTLKHSPSEERVIENNQSQN
jgi:hypothetical protein